MPLNSMLKSTNPALQQSSAVHLAVNPEFINQKMAIKRFAPVILTLFLAAASTSACGPKQPANELEEIWKDGVMRVALAVDYPPGGTPDEGGETSAFFTGLFEEIAKRMGVGIELVYMPDESLVRAVSRGELDAGAGANIFTPPPDQAVDFADPFFLTSPPAGETGKFQDNKHAGEIPVYVIIPDGAKELRLKLNQVMVGMIEEGFINRLAQKHNIPITIDFLNQ